MVGSPLCNAQDTSSILVVQEMGVCLAMHGTPVSSLGRESTYLRAAKPVSHNYRACRPQSPCSVTRGHHSEKPVHSSLCSLQQEKASVVTKTQSSQQINKYFFFSKKLLTALETDTSLFMNQEMTSKYLSQFRQLKAFAFSNHSQGLLHYYWTNSLHPI